MIFTLISIVLAQADGGHDFAVNDAGGSYSAPLYETCPAAPPSLVLDGGFLLFPPERAARIACLMETCESDRMRREKAMRDAPAEVPVWWQLLGVGAVSMLTGFTLAKVLVK